MIVIVDLQSEISLLIICFVQNLKGKSSFMFESLTFFSQKVLLRFCFL